MDNCQNETSYHLEMVRLTIDAAIECVQNKDKCSTKEDVTDTLKTAIQLVDDLEITFQKLDEENRNLKFQLAKRVSTQFVQGNDE